MISAPFLRIWTTRGWRYSWDLTVGDKIISFNPDRNCTEYDEVYSVQQEWQEMAGLGIYSKSMRQLLTPDHPIMIWNNKRKTLNRVPIESRFMGCINRSNSIIYNAMYEPYKRTQDLEDIKWSARIAATYSMYDVPVDIWDVIAELGGYEAQIWLDTFFHWNSMLYQPQWQYTVRMPSKHVRDIILHIAPRAGVGCYWGQPSKHGQHWTMSISDTSNVNVRAEKGWVTHPVNLVFNIASRNGNFLAGTIRGTFLTACNYKEN